MSYTITTGIVDNDAKGTTGRGTIHWMTVTQGSELIERHEWGFMEELAGKFSKAAIVAKYVAENKRIANEQLQNSKAVKQAEKQERIDEVDTSPAKMLAITWAIAQPGAAKAIEQWRAGKEKALNAVVGMAIKKMKDDGAVVPDAMALAVLLKKHLTASD